LGNIDNDHGPGEERVLARPVEFALLVDVRRDREGQEGNDGHDGAYKDVPDLKKAGLARETVALSRLQLTHCMMPFMHSSRKPCDAVCEARQRK
jgi:hypothetical protein